MGTFKIEVTIGKYQGDNHVPVTGLVVGRSRPFTQVPAKLLASLGVHPTSTYAVRLPDGSLDEKPFATAGLRYNGKEAPVPVIFVDDHHPIVIGETTLEYLFLQADFENERLVRAKVYGKTQHNRHTHKLTH